jgi:hypothetical protein
MEEQIIPKNEAEPEPIWHVGILKQLESLELSADSGIDPATEPDWVVNVLKQLVQQTMPAVSLKPHEFTPHRLGRLLGQQQANWDAADTAAEKALTPERMAQLEAFMVKLQENESNPAVASLLRAIDFATDLIIAAESLSDRFKTITIDALKAVWEQPNLLDRRAFFQGLAEGLSKPGFPSRATDATPIYQRLLVHRAEIQQFRSVRELREFLRRCGLSEQVLGPPKRLEKICERIGLSFAKAGRPRIAEIPTT